MRPLKPRERQCLELMSLGLSVEQIGKCLHLGSNTVKTHLRTAYRALGVHGKAHAVRRCYERGIFKVPAPVQVQAERVS